MKSCPPERAAFTLIELLAVIGIAVVLLTLAIPTFQAINSSRQIDLVAGILSDELNTARTQAIARQHPVELCFLEGSSAGAYRTVQIRAQQSNGEFEWTGRTRKLVEGVAFFPTFSNTLSTQSPTTFSAAPPIRRGVALRFYPSGRVERADETATPLPSAEPNLTLTIGLQHDLDNAPDTLPKNFATLQVHPRTGKVTLYRP